MSDNEEVSGRGPLGEGTRALIGGAAFVVIAAVVAVILIATHSSGSKVNTSPENIGQEAGNNWLTNGGGYTNDRHSPLDEINTSNVAQLKGTWLTKLNGSGVGTKYSAEGQTLAYDGTLYISTGADDVFAVDVATGKIKWQYTANMPASLAATICCGWDSRGVAIGDGLVYSPGLDGTLTALDINTGKQVWKTTVAKASDGFSITAAPLYYKGMVFTSPSGAEYGIRGFVDAYDAKTGKRLWRHYNIPAPGQPGGDSWPSNNDEWAHGGASVWNTPTIDPKFGMIYYSTSNAGDDFDGSARAGDNKWSSSILALDIKTGAFKWGYQQVHHDLWDLDSTSPTLLVDFKTSDGVDRQGILEPNKDGYVYLVDRKTGKPFDVPGFRIPEKPVPANEDQKASPTQPTPEMPGFTRQQVSASDLVALKAGIKAQLKPGAKMPTITGGGPFAQGVSRTDSIVAEATGASGGDNWEPSSYDPDTQLYFVCSHPGAQAFFLNSAHQTFKKGTTYIGNTRYAGILGFSPKEGEITAYDLTTGKIKWQNQLDQSCYSGTANTAGGLVFVGSNDGNLVAYDEETGKSLWSFQTGAGANTTVTPFEYNGHEYIAFLAGGNALGGTSKGDNLWLFSLNGTLGPVAAGSASKAVEHAGGGPAKTTPKTSTGTAGNATAGKQVFTDNCATCHGLSGHGGNGGPDLRGFPQAKTVSGVTKQVTNGGGGMPAFKGTLTSKQINDVAAYVTSTITK